MNRRDFLKLASIGGATAIATGWALTHNVDLDAVFASPNQAPKPNELGIDPLAAPPDMADAVFGAGQWGKADNFSAYRVYVGNAAAHDQPDLATPGVIRISDPTGTEGQDHQAIDWKANAVNALFTVNYDQMPLEIDDTRKQNEERHGLDSHMIWVRGNGDVKFTYVWGDGTQTVVAGHVTGERFSGTIDGVQPLECPAAFQMAFINQAVVPGTPDALIASKIFKAAPAAVLVQAVADKGCELTLPTGMSSGYDGDGEGNRDYQDAGFLFAQ